LTSSPKSSIVEIVTTSLTSISMKK
jgi:hypothetical protein